MSHHVEDKHASLMNLGQNDPATESFKDSYDVTPTEKSRVVEKL